LYLKRTGDGTVCYLTLGHCRGRFDVQDLGIDDLGRRDFGSWEVPEFRAVLGRCLAWAVTGSFPDPREDGPGVPPMHRQSPANFPDPELGQAGCPSDEQPSY
jgi:hypothetical protein